MAAVGGVAAELRVVLPLGHLFCARAVPPLLEVLGTPAASWRRSGPRRVGPYQLRAGRRDSSQAGRGGAALAPRSWPLLGRRSGWAHSRCCRGGWGEGALGRRGKLHPRRRPLEAGNARLGFDFYLKSQAVSPLLFWGYSVGLCRVNCRSAFSCRVCVLRGGSASLQNRGPPLPTLIHK